MSEKEKERKQWNGRWGEKKEWKMGREEEG